MSRATCPCSKIVSDTKLCYFKSEFTTTFDKLLLCVQYLFGEYYPVPTGSCLNKECFGTTSVDHLLTSLYSLFMSMFQFYARCWNTSSTGLHSPHHQTPGGYVLVKDHGSRVRDSRLLAHGDTLTTQ